MNIQDFSLAHPEYSFDFGAPIQQQKRIFDLAVLDSLPEELTPSYEVLSRKGRGRPNLNQTLTHAQCNNCKRVLRNDFFYTPPSIIQRNGIHTLCRTCTKQSNAERYEANAEIIRKRRNAIWRYIAPQCSLCGFDKDVSAIDMHHVGRKEAIVSALITEFALSPDAYKASKLLHEAKMCVPLCSNCHRMLHANVLQLPTDIKPLDYHLVELLRLIDAKTTNK
jgi:hypothetical protein